MFRDRTNLFLSYRRTYPHHSESLGSGASRFDSLEEEEGLIGTAREDANRNIELVSLPPSFMDISEEIDENLAEIQKMVDKLNALYKKNLLPGFNDRTTDEEEIEKLNFSITTKFFGCNNLVKKFHAIKSDPRFKADDINMIDNMQKNYALKIQQLSSNFRKLQNNYIRFLKKDEFEPVSNIKQTKPDQTLDPALDDTEEMESYSREAIKESSTILQQASNINDSLIRQREQEITKLAQGVLEVSSIFKEMQNMIIDQGTIVDRIDYNIENTKVDLKDATKQLDRATHYQKRTQKCKIILLLTLLVVLLFVIVLTKPHKHFGGTSSGNNNNNNNNNNDNNNISNENDSELPATTEAMEEAESDIPDKDREPVEVTEPDDGGELDPSVNQFSGML